MKSQASWIFEWRFSTAIAMVLLTVNRQGSLDERFSGVSLRTSLSRTPAWSFPPENRRFSDRLNPATENQQDRSKFSVMTALLRLLSGVE
jgi:hypothetical protein